MSTNNMAASWRQANDVIAPGWSRYARVYQWAERVPASVAARLAGVRADSSFFITSMYFTIWPRFGTTGYLRFGQIWSDLVIRVTQQLQLVKS